ncbi:MAG: hypothetical protein A3F10_00970 [Coxiella sp. RIFCSPHIGHO2_12_FULL_42_15]|nr:MAG: hypothetical protein A3F10_00970 [Coxiella sp. RIFCSPHIGHO2_12_FULL_42_15]
MEKKNLLSKLRISKNTKRLITLIVGCAFLLLLWFMVIAQAQQRKFHQLLQYYDQKKQEQETQQKKITELKSLLEKKNLIQARYQRKIETLLPHASIEEILKKITELGDDQKLEYVFLKPKPIVVEDFFQKIPIQLAVLGNYHQIAHFISELANLSSLFLVNGFVLEQTNPAQPRLSMHLALEVLTQTPLQPTSNLPSLYEPLTFQYAHRRSPFMSPAPDPLSPTAIASRYAISSLKLIGILLGEDKKRAFLQSPDGVLHQIEQGSVVGAEKGEVISINENAIELISSTQGKPRKILLMLNEIE